MVGGLELTIHAELRDEPRGVHVEIVIIAVVVDQMRLASPQHPADLIEQRHLAPLVGSTRKRVLRLEDSHAAASL